MSITAQEPLPWQADDSGAAGGEAQLPSAEADLLSTWLMTALHVSSYAKCFVIRSMAMLILG